LEEKISADVKRSIHKSMGCVPKVIKKKRRILEIFKSQQLEGEEPDPDETDIKCVTVDLSTDKESNSEDDSTDYNCLICDRRYTSIKEFESHKKIHPVVETSSLILTVERDIFNNILAEESDPVTDTPAKISDSLLDNYDELLENLISSVTPDEMLEKISITNEIPDDYSFTKQSVVKASVAYQKPIRMEKGLKSVFQAKSKSQKRSLVEDKEEDRTDAKRPKLERFSSEKVDFHNKLNGKIFNVLSKDSSCLTRREVETESLRFSLTTPLPSLTLSPAPTLHPHPHKITPAVCSRNNRVFQARMESGEKLCEAVRRGKALKKKKKNTMRRGTVGYLLKMESDYGSIEQEKEEKEEEDGLIESGRFPSTSVEPSSQQTSSLISNRATEAERETPTEEPKSEEVLLSMPVFEI